MLCGHVTVKAKKSTEEKLEAVSGFSEVVDSQIKIQKSLTFLNKTTLY